MVEGKNRRFLFLQGPHGPFLRQLARALSAAGAQVLRVGFNAGDRAFWGRRPGYLAYEGRIEDWPDTLRALVRDNAITDILLYGDARPVHAAARAVAAEAGLTLHVLEEGYLRPYWISYERGGSNGNSPLARMSLPEIRARLGGHGADHTEAPDHWGALRSHILYGALYHFCILTMNRRYGRVQRHRTLTVGQEFRLYLRKLALAPWIWPRRQIASRRVRRGGFAYHLVLLQLEHDASFQAYSPIASQADFAADVLDAFARGAPAHHHLVFKAHPLEDGRVPLRRLVLARAAELGIAARVHYLDGGKTGRLLDHAESAVTVNSTAAQQALWRGLPLKALGQSIYAKPEFVSAQPLDRFFAAPDTPDIGAYRDYRQFLLLTSQLPGSFYAANGRRQAIRRLVEAMLDPRDPYAALEGVAAAPQHLRAV